VSASVRRFLAGAFAVLFLGPAPARAEERAPAPDVVDLPAVIRLAREASPRLSIERQALAGAEANRITAGAYPNPSVSYGLSRPSGGQATQFDGTRQQQATVEVPLLIAGQRSARIDKAEREIEAARARVVSGSSSLSAEASALFVALLAAQEKAALLTAAHEELNRLRDIVAGREASGMASRYDLIRLEVELGGIRMKIEEAKADVSDRAGNLAALLGLRNWRPRASGDLRPLTVVADALANPRDRAQTSPAAQTAIREESLAQSGVEVARRERWPVPSVSAGRAWTSEPYGASNFMGLSIEIPIFDTRQGPLARAEAEARAAAFRRELVVAEVAANLERLANVIAIRQVALQRFELEASARLPSLKQMAEDAYRLGRSSIFELLDSTRSRYDLQQTRIDLVAALLEAQLRFLATSGELERSAGLAPPEPSPR
jgi:cobalt-zinc-cadmium efflux system outer membrane protein